MGRATQGVKVMNIADDDRVSAVAIVVEQDEADALPDGQAVVADELPLEGAAADPETNGADASSNEDDAPPSRHGHPGGHLPDRRFA